MTDINPDAPDGVKCMWCEDASIGGQNIKLLLIDNRNLKEQKTATVQRREQKEYERLTQKLKKLSTDPCSCRKDAEKAVRFSVMKALGCRKAKADRGGSFDVRQDIAVKKVIFH